MTAPGEQQNVLQKDGHTEEKTEMKSTRTALLVGIAALALVAGNGFASAQEKSESGKGATPHAAQQMNHSGTSGQSSQGAQAQEHGSMSKQGQRAEEAGKASAGEKATTSQNRAPKEEQNRAAQSNEKKGTTATENERSKRSNTAQERERMGGQNAAERNRNGNTAAEQQTRTGGTAQQQNRTGGGNMNAERGRTGTEGLQSNASGMNVRLTEQQRSEIRTTVINGHGAPRVAHVDFDVTVGTVIPRGRVHVVAVPEMLVRIEPAWRGFLYFVYEDEVVIVDPNDMKIVAVVPA
jgi:uncharacterized protein DUF1236